MIRPHACMVEHVIEYRTLYSVLSVGWEKGVVLDFGGFKFFIFRSGIFNY